VGKALLGANMAKQGYLLEERLEPLEWGPYVPGDCVICIVVTAMVRWHGPNHEKPARLPNGPSLNPPQDCLVSEREGGKVLLCRDCSLEHQPRLRVGTWPPQAAISSCHCTWDGEK